MIILSIMVSLFLSVSIPDPETLSQLATFQEMHQCTQVVAEYQVCVPLTTGEVALYGPS